MDRAFPLMVKKLMRPADRSISVNHPSVPDNERVGLGNSLALGSTGTAERCPYLDGSARDENALGIR